MNKMNILHVTDDPNSSIRLWNDVSEVLGMYTNWDIAISFEEVTQINFDVYDLVLFCELKKIPFREMIESNNDFLESIKHKTIFLSKSIKLRKYGFNVVVESKLLDKLSREQQP